MEHANRHSHSSSIGSHDDASTSSQAVYYPGRDQERARLMNNRTPPNASSTNTNADLEKPLPPFMGIASGSRSCNNNSSTALNSGRSSPVLQSHASEHKLPEAESSVSLSAHYLPSKFSTTMLHPGPRRRKGRGKGDADPHIPKMGGGTEAFRSGEDRMPAEGDEDYDGVNLGVKGQKKMTWNRFKWILFSANVVLTVYSLISLIICLLTWFNIWTKADIVRVGNRPELVISTLAAVMGVFTSLVGWAGILLNNRSFLAIYNLLLWITFLFLIAPGYITYRRHTFNLEGKINAQWSRNLGIEGRMRIQDQLRCCGYFSPFVEATVSQTCYSRSILPGCKLHYMQFERMVLRRWYTAVFSIAPVHILIMIAALLCSNHVTYRFGKGMMPKAYRLSMNSMAVIMDNYATQLAEQYGNDLATEILQRSRSGWQLDGLPAVGYSQSLSKTPSLVQMTTMSNKYDSIASKGE